MNINTASTIPYSAMASNGTLTVEDIAARTTPAILHLDDIGYYITADPIESRLEGPYERLERRIEALEAKLKLVAPYIPEDIDVGELL